MLSPLRLPCSEPRWNIHTASGSCARGDVCCGACPCRGSTNKIAWFRALCPVTLPPLLDLHLPPRPRHFFSSSLLSSGFGRHGARCVCAWRSDDDGAPYGEEHLDLALVLEAGLALNEWSKFWRTPARLSPMFGSGVGEAFHAHKVAEVSAHHLVRRGYGGAAKHGRQHQRRVRGPNTSFSTASATRRTDPACAPPADNLTSTRPCLSFVPRSVGVVLVLRHRRGVTGWNRRIPHPRTVVRGKFLRDGETAQRTYWR